MKKDRRVVLIIQARMASKRLPGKSMMNLAGVPLVGRILERVKRCRTFDDIMNHWQSNDLGKGPMKNRIKTVSLIQRKTSKYTVDFSPVILDNNKWVVFPWESK